MLIAIIVIGIIIIYQLHIISDNQAINGKNQKIFMNCFSEMHENHLEMKIFLESISTNLKDIDSDFSRYFIQPLKDQENRAYKKDLWNQITSQKTDVADQCK